MKSKKKGRGTSMKVKEMIITAIVLVAFVSSAPLALAAELTIKPSVNVVPGTPITINGTGFNSSETVTISATVTCYKPVSDGRCECTMHDFDLPANISLKLSVRRVTDNVSIYIKKGFWWKISPGLTSFFTFEYTGNPVYTSNVGSGKILPALAGTYSIDVIGDAVPGEENCTMVTSAELEVDADAAGNFSLTFDTHGIPLCNFTLNATDESGNSAEATMNLFQLGDPSMDGQINAYDCCCIARYWAGITGYDDNTIAPSAAAGLAPDCDLVTLEDARCLAEHLIGMYGIPCDGCP
jgi:hypothetical protein